MSNPIYLDHDRVAPLGLIERHGLNEEWISPFDIPESITIGTNGQHEIFALEFNYPGGTAGGSIEQLVSDPGGRVEIRTAVRSGKILEIFFSPAIPTGSLASFAVVLELASRSQVRKSRKFNFFLISKILANWKNLGLTI